MKQSVWQMIRPRCSTELALPGLLGRFVPWGLLVAECFWDILLSRKVVSKKLLREHSRMNWNEQSGPCWISTWSCLTALILIQRCQLYSQIYYTVKPETSQAVFNWGEFTVIQAEEKSLVTVLLHLVYEWGKCSRGSWGSGFTYLYLL